jgi:hypothetical protein
LEAEVLDHQYQQRPAVMALVQFLAIYLLLAAAAEVLKQVLRPEALVKLVVVVVVRVILAVFHLLLDKALLGKVMLVVYRPKLFRHGRRKVAVAVLVLLDYLLPLMLLGATAARVLQVQ